MLRGALCFNDQPARGGAFEAHIGPPVPYVIPRVLELDTMVAVIGELAMDCGYTAYPIAYFCEKRPPPEDLTCDWPRTIYNYHTSLGEGAWQAPIDKWDFELLPWLQQGKLRWCEPGSDNMKLADEAPQSCPYLNLPGERERMIVEGLEVWGAGLPDGTPIDPLD